MIAILRLNRRPQNRLLSIGFERGERFFEGQKGATIRLGELV